MGQLRTTLPQVSPSAEPECIPQERVEEHPDICSIDDDQREDIEQYLWENAQQDINNTDADDSTIYVSLFAAAPITKIRGYISWVHEPEEMKYIKCGRDTEHLLTIASKETGALGRWDVIDEESPDKNTKQTLTENVDKVFTTELCINGVGR